MDKQYLESHLFQGSKVKLTTEIFKDKIGIVLEVLYDSFHFKELINELSVYNYNAKPEYRYHIIEKSKVVAITSTNG